MASAPTKLTVLHRYPISPPPRSVPPASLPLTFLDIPWLLFPPAQPLFFYDFSTSTAHFTQTILPNLKRTLSLTLQHFFPLAGNLDTPPPPADPTLEYSDGDCVLLTVAEAAATWAGGFDYLAGNHLKIARDLHCLVPVLRSGVGPKQQPLLAVQITIFPGAGICLGFTLRHVAADWRTFNNFLKAWAELARNFPAIPELDPFVAFHDRSVIRDPAGLAHSFLKEWRSIAVRTAAKKSSEENEAKFSYDTTTRATFVMGPKEMERIKKWILDRSETLFGTSRILLSPYVLACAFVWASWMKAHFPWSESEGGHGHVHYLGFIAGGVTRVGYSVPSTYVGNCVGFGRAGASRRELLGENGVAYAAKALGDTIERLNEDLMSGAKGWISEWQAIRDRESEGHVMVTGSPKVGLYGLDFGWGRPAKIEEVSIDTTGAISLCEGRDVVGSVEIGLALPKSKMEAFATLFKKGIN